MNRLSCFFRLRLTSSARLFCRLVLLFFATTLLACVGPVDDGGESPTPNPQIEPTPELEVLTPDEAALLEVLDRVKSHIAGDTTLTAPELISERANIEEAASLFKSSPTLIETGFDIVDLYDSAFGALFTSGSTTDNGIASRTASGNEL